MHRPPPSLAGLTLLAAAACARAAAPAGPSPVAAVTADSGRPPFNAADVAFMSGMIGHHAQAILMAGWAPSHGAGPSVRALCERIVVGQRDEIVTMQRWLRERHLVVPNADPAHGAIMPGMDHPMLMPGMLTPTQMAQLDSARGADFDRLFLGFMIQHHQGAVTMVQQLFDAPGALIDDAVFKYSSDVNADQTTEIDRMQRMLAAMDSHGAGR